MFIRGRQRYFFGGCAVRSSTTIFLPPLALRPPLMFMEPRNRALYTIPFMLSMGWGLRLSSKIKRCLTLRFYLHYHKTGDIFRSGCGVARWYKCVGRLHGWPGFDSSQVSLWRLSAEQQETRVDLIFHIKIVCNVP